MTFFSTWASTSPFSLAAGNFRADFRLLYRQKLLENPVSYFTCLAQLAADDDDDVLPLVLGDVDDLLGPGLHQPNPCNSFLLMRLLRGRFFCFSIPKLDFPVWIPLPQAILEFVLL